jgi:hypothetical protein
LGRFFCFDLFLAATTMKLLCCLLLITASCIEAFKWPWDIQAEEFMNCRLGGCTPRTILGVGPFASLDIIEQEFKRLSLIVHTDKGGLAEVSRRSLQEGWQKPI